MIDDFGESKGFCWFATEDKASAEFVTKLHNKKLGGYPLKTYVMGHPYSTLEEDDLDDDEHQDIKIEKALMK